MFHLIYLRIRRSKGRNTCIHDACKRFLSRIFCRADIFWKNCAAIGGIGLDGSCAHFTMFNSITALIFSQHQLFRLDMCQHLRRSRRNVHDERFDHRRAAVFFLRQLGKNACVCRFSVMGVLHHCVRTRFSGQSSHLRKCRFSTNLQRNTRHSTGISHQQVGTHAQTAPPD